MRFITSRFEETVEELTSTKSPNYVLLTPNQVQIVINGHKMDHRSQEADYDPTKDMPKMDLEASLALVHAASLRNVDRDVHDRFDFIPVVWIKSCGNISAMVEWISNTSLLEAGTPACGCVNFTLGPGAVAILELVGFNSK